MNGEPDFEDWVVVSSSEESCDSDKIDSDIEAELYSAIHHETDTNRACNNVSNCESPQASIVELLKQNSVTPQTSVTAPPKLKTNTDLFVEDKSVNTKLKTSLDVVDKRKPLQNSSNDVIPIKACIDFKWKRKSNALVNVLETTQPKRKREVSSKECKDDNEEISFKKQKTTNDENYRSKSNKPSTLNKTIEIESSDSDSIIWTEADGGPVTELQTNVEPEVVPLSSDTFSDESNSSFEESCLLSVSSTNTPQPSTSFVSDDPWHVNSDDLYRFKRRSQRYHDVLHCTNCKLKGHTINFCSVPKSVKCYICGGDHMGTRCRDVVCSRCFRVGHNARFCNQNVVEVCVLCNMRGHPVKHCPDLWRRYNHTITQGKIIVPNPVAQDTPIYCYNCGAEGHYGAVCRGPRSDRLSFQTWTSVIAHVHPGDTIQQTMQVQRNTALGGISTWSPINAFKMQPLPSPRPPKPKKNRKKKNKQNKALQTPQSVDKKTTIKKEIKKEVCFPRTPKQYKKKIRRSQKKNVREPFMNGLHRRLGLSSAATNFTMHNSGFSY